MKLQQKKLWRLFSQATIFIDGPTVEELSRVDTLRSEENVSTTTKPIFCRTFSTGASDARRFTD